MERVPVTSPEGGFRIIAKTARSEAATMILHPGETTGGPDNRHAGDQWLYVVAGRGEAVVEGREVSLGEGDLLMIEAGERHEVRCLGDAPLETLNIYAPPTY
ncbi:MAG: cupin domain-containing protein [Gammaproteobacteria bacterium]|nr:cupin domain-containing protein [Gammaproteobacteria bacterium]